jgi:hypothetical protein
MMEDRARHLCEVRVAELSSSTDEELLDGLQRELEEKRFAGLPGNYLVADTAS